MIDKEELKLLLNANKISIKYINWRRLGQPEYTSIITLDPTLIPENAENLVGLSKIDVITANEDTMFKALYCYDLNLNKFKTFDLKYILEYAVI
jgi:hypothetical protein